MASRRPRFRTGCVFAISAGGMLVMFAVGIAITGTLMRSADAVAARRVTTTGTIGRTRLGSEHDVAEVVWQDDHQVSHTARFSFSYPGDWHEGEAFGVSYDPADPNGRVLAARGYRGYVDDLHAPPWLGLLVVVTGLACCALPLAFRVLFNLRARIAPASEWHARLCVDTGDKRVVRKILLLLTPVDDVDVPGGRYWQPVVWSPALAELTEGRIVRARMSRGFSRRVVVEAPDGSTVWPAGRLRTDRPFSPVVWPSSWTFRRPRPGLAAIGFLIAPFIGDIDGDHGHLAFRLSLSGVLAGAACFYAVYLFAWGWQGGVFGRVPRGTDELPVPRRRASAAELGDVAGRARGGRRRHRRVRL